MMTINIAPNDLKQQFLTKIELKTALKVLESSRKNNLQAMCLFTLENVE